MPRNTLGISFKPVKIGYSPFGLPPNKDKGRKPIGKSLRDQVWLNYMGNKAQGKCYCCRIVPIHITNFQVGHNKAVAKGGKNNMSNLRPICGTCNRGMKTKSIEWYKKKYFSNGGGTRKPTKKPTRRPKPANPWEFKPIQLGL